MRNPVPVLKAPTLSGRWKVNPKQWEPQGWGDTQRWPLLAEFLIFPSWELTASWGLGWEESFLTEN